MQIAHPKCYRCRKLSTLFFEPQENAKNNEIDVLYDDIAVDNYSGQRLFMKCGFIKDYQTDDYIMLKKELN